MYCRTHGAGSRSHCYYARTVITKSFHDPKNIKTILNLNKILGARRVTRTKFNHEDAKVLRETVQNSVDPEPWVFELQYQTLLNYLSPTPRRYYPNVCLLDYYTV